MVSDIVWSCSIFAQSGYSEEARNAILALDGAGVRVHASPLFWTGWVTRLPPATMERLERLITIDLPERFVHVQHHGPPSYYPHPRALVNIGRPMCETEAIPEEWVPYCNAMDEIWVPSEFNVETFARGGVRREKLRAVPECLQLELYDPGVPPLEIPNAKGFVFLSVFAWSRRKGWDLLVRAYVEEFAADEDVTLVLKAAETYATPTAVRVGELQTYIREDLKRDLARCPRIIVIGADPGAEGMPRLYRAADAFVLPSRGEGWGRPYMEAMAMGLPTIGTRWSGQLDFMDDENSYLLDCELVDVEQVGRKEGRWWSESRFARGQRWAEPSLAHLRRLMRHVFTDRRDAMAKGGRARAHVRRFCSPAHVAEVMLLRLEALGVG